MFRVLYLNLGLRLADVAAEKTQQTLMSGIETFDPSSLKHTETQEKIFLPDMDGTVSRFIHLCTFLSLKRNYNFKVKKMLQRKFTLENYIYIRK